MKKVSLLILLVIVASTLMMAAIPTRTVRLTIINKSGYDVMMKLTGSELTGMFYYLTVPAGSRDEPTYKVFTVMSDVYKRETWQCGGVKTSGVLIVDGNIRLTFVPCFELPCATSVNYRIWFRKCDGQAFIEFVAKRYPRIAGEPRMEKVSAWRYFVGRDQLFPDFKSKDFRRWYWYLIEQGYYPWITSCGLLWWRIATFRTPIGCQWRYQY